MNADQEYAENQEDNYLREQYKQYLEDKIGNFFVIDVEDGVHIFEGD